MRDAFAQVGRWLAGYGDEVSAAKSSRRSVDRLFLVRDILTTAYVYLGAMADYADHAGNTSRGSVLYTNPDGDLPVAGYGDDPNRPLDLEDVFRFRLDGGAFDGQVQECDLAAGGCGARADGDEALDADAARSLEVRCRWRAVRPIPEDDGFFENVWRSYRQNGNVDD